MSIDLRVKHDLESRRRAVELFDAGVGCKPAAEALSVPRETVREWQWVYRAFGSEALLSMDGKQSRYTFEQRVAAASAVVDGGMAKTDAMAEFGIRSKSPLERWCRLYREAWAFRALWPEKCTISIEIDHKQDSRRVKNGGSFCACAKTVLSTDTDEKSLS